MFFVSDGTISWNSKHLPTMALSTKVAKYMATNHSAKEAMWLRLLMVDVGCVLDGATTIKCDNQGCIALAKIPKHHSYTKHIDVRHHFNCEAIEDKVIELEYCSTESMVADVLTKALGRERHVMITKAMGLERYVTLQSRSVGFEYLIWFIVLDLSVRTCVEYKKLVAHECLSSFTTRKS